MKLMTVQTKTPPGRKPKLYRYRGKWYSMVELDAMSELSKVTIQSRLKRKWSVERAINEPMTDPKEAGRRGGIVRKCDRGRKHKGNRSVNATPGVQPEANSTGTGPAGTPCSSDHQ